MQLQEVSLDIDGLKFFKKGANGDCYIYSYYENIYFIKKISFIRRALSEKITQKL